MQTTVNIRRAKREDLDAICQLLLTEHLPVTDLNPALEHFFIAVDNNEITGVIGMDQYGDKGLLRSAIVKADRRNKGIAGALIHQLIEEARGCGITELYLITNTAAAYFEGKGFIKILREGVPASVLESKEFNGLCPASSAIMYRKL